MIGGSYKQVMIQTSKLITAIRNACIQLKLFQRLHIFDRLARRRCRRRSNSSDSSSMNPIINIIDTLPRLNSRMDPIIIISN